MFFSIDITDTNVDMTITLKNLNLELLQTISTEDSISTVLSEKYYMYAMFDKLELLGVKFMVLKNSKKSVVLLRV